jgi:UDP-N-acetylglucosamine--N-acetylmuramyl-(pentapeptide) pyrophosphoryl-undecaprenol N-acetylglucosamine transferase
VLATGGYISAAVVPAARLLRVTVMLLAADVMPDRTNRTLSRWAELVATVSQSAADVFTKTPTIVTGMPVRPEILDVDPAAARQQLAIAPSATVLLVTGGSQGAQRINDATVAALPHLLADPDIFIIHLTGVGKLPAPEQLKGLPEDRYLVTERRDDMGTCLAAADIVLTRAGANGVAEAAAWGRPMIVVPYPHAGGHQRLNAAIYEKAGAAVVIDDADFTGDVLLSTMQNLRANPERLEEMACAAKDQGSATAAEQIAAELRRLADGRDTAESAEGTDTIAR